MSAVNVVVALESTEREIVEAAWHLVHMAARAGFVLTIERLPLQPLAMGNHCPVVDVRPARGGQAC